jgi:hypothetical protein
MARLKSCPDTRLEFVRTSAPEGAVWIWSCFPGLKSGVYLIANSGVCIAAKFGASDLGLRAGF